MAQLDSTTWLATTATNPNTSNTAAGPGTAPNNRGAGDPHNVVKAREDQLAQQQQHGQSFEDVTQQQQQQQQQQRGLLKIPSSVGKCSMFTQTEHTNR
jgi:xanthine dehydrogenase molybdopterin-binding subunit B